MSLASRCAELRRHGRRAALSAACATHARAAAALLNEFAASELPRHRTEGAARTSYGSTAAVIVRSRRALSWRPTRERGQPTGGRARRQKDWCGRPLRAQPGQSFNFIKSANRGEFGHRESKLVDSCSPVCLPAAQRVNLRGECRDQRLRMISHSRTLSHQSSRTGRRHFAGKWIILSMIDHFLRAVAAVMLAVGIDVCERD